MYGLKRKRPPGGGLSDNDRFSRQIILPAVVDFRLLSLVQILEEVHIRTQYLPLPG